MLTFNWNNRWIGKNLLEMWTDFKMILTDEADLHILLRKTVKKKKNYLFKRNRKLIKEKENAWKKYRQNSSGKNFENYKQIRRFNSRIWQEEDYHRKQLLQGFKGNPKNFMAI